MPHFIYRSFPHSSIGRESTSNAGDPGSIPRLGRSTGEGIGYPLQYSWAFLVAQLVKNPPAMRETWVHIPGLQRSSGEGNSYLLQYSGLENSRDTVHGVTNSRTRLGNFRMSENCKMLSSFKKIPFLILLSFFPPYLISLEILLIRPSIHPSL